MQKVAGATAATGAGSILPLRLKCGGNCNCARGREASCRARLESWRFGPEPWSRQSPRGSRGEISRVRQRTDETYGGQEAQEHSTPPGSNTSPPQCFPRVSPMANDVRPRGVSTFGYAAARAPETTPARPRLPSRFRRGVPISSPPQMRRGGAPGDGVLLSRKCRNSMAPLRPRRRDFDGILSPARFPLPCVAFIRDTGQHSFPARSL